MRISSLQKSVDKHNKYLNTEDGVEFNHLVLAMKNSVTEEGYKREKAKIDNLIRKQPETCRKPLDDMIKFWNNVKYRWASAFKSNLHNAPRSIMKAGGEKNLSLVDAVMSDISDSARLDAMWLNRTKTEKDV